MKKGWPQLLAGTALVLAASTAFGNAFFGPNPQPGSLTWSGFSNGSVSATITGGSLSNVSAGEFYGFFDPAAEGDAPGHEVDDYLRFFCIDIFNLANAGPNPYTRDLLTSLTPDQLTELTRLFDDYYPNKTTGTYYNGGITNFGDFGSNSTASAAFQLAVWEIFFGNGASLTSAPFTASSAAEATAQAWLDAINAESGTPGGWTFYALTSNSGRYQMYLTAEYTQPLRTVPEPGTLVLFGGAVFTAWAAALRRRQPA
jgi:hypothetical protein